MKKIYFPLLATMILVASCQMKTKTVPYDPIAAKAEVSKALDSINMAAKARDNKTFLSFFTEDGLYCGTDPKELWTKEDYAKLVEKMLADTTMHFDMKITNRKYALKKMEIRLLPWNNLSPGGVNRSHCAAPCIL